MNHEEATRYLDDLGERVPDRRPPMAALLASGRVVRRRRALKTLTLIAASAALILGVGAGARQIFLGSDDSGDREIIASDVTATVDPRAVSDVIEGTFGVPGPGQRRSIRINTFVRSWMAQQCGGQGASINSTAERFSQDTTPDLELIRERGFTEDYVNMFAGADRDCDAGSPGNLVDQVPTFQTWFEVKGLWVEVQRSVIADDRVTALKEPLARCLQQRSGLNVSVANPATRYLSAVDGAGDDATQRLATIYADCGKAYFAMIQKLMLEQRPEWIEEHRELLEKFAGELIAMGYVP
jgi:hypothetical protein